MPTLNTNILQGQTPGGSARKAATKGILAKTALCPLCNKPMPDGSKTDFRQIRLEEYGKPYTICKRVHQVCPED